MSRGCMAGSGRDRFGLWEIDFCRNDCMGTRLRWTLTACLESISDDALDACYFIFDAWCCMFRWSV